MGDIVSSLGKQLGLRTYDSDRAANLNIGAQPFNIISNRYGTVDPATNSGLNGTVVHEAYLTTDGKAYKAGLKSRFIWGINFIEDESFELDLPPYLSKALVYYLKAKQAEENLDIERKEYFMREFKKIVEKHESSKISGPRRIMGFGMTR